MNLSWAQREKKLFVHLSELESFPKISDADLIVPDISESQKREVTLAMDFDRCFLFIASFTVDKALTLLQFHRCTQLLGHLFFSNADK